MREVRAVVLGLFVVLLVAVGVAYWRRPARELKHVKGYRVEIEKSQGSSKKHVSFTVPITFVARIASMIPISDIGADLKTKWGEGELTARDILDAADQSSAGKPTVLTRDHSKIEVTADGSAIEVLVKDDWDKTVRVRVPRTLIEGLSGEKRVSPRDILKKLDEMGPGDVIVIRDRDDQVTITAEPK